MCDFFHLPFHLLHAVLGSGMLTIVNNINCVLSPSDVRLVLAKGKHRQDIGRREESEDRVFIP